MKTHIGCLVLVLGIVPARIAWAESTEGKERTARKLCLSGNYAKGVEILSDLFVRTMNPNHIFNQGRCFEQSRRFEDAISRFEEYLRVAKRISPEDRTDAEKHIADCQNRLAPQTGQPPAQAVPQAVVAPTAPLVVASPAPFVAVPPAASVVPGQMSASGSQGKGLRTAGIICAVVGLAALGTGIGLALETQSIASNAEKNGGGTQAQEDRRKTLVTWGWVSYGVGAAALATGVVLYIVGWPSNQSDKVALLPVLSTDGASLTLKGKF